MPRLWALLALALGACAQQDVDLEALSADEFKTTVTPMIQDFIFSQYRRFAASELTFRHLKEHVSEMTGMPYNELKSDLLSSVIEDETDRIANGCNGGAMPEAECRRKMNYQGSAKEEL